MTRSTLADFARTWARGFNTRRLLEELARGAGHATILGAILWLAYKLSAPIEAVLALAALGVVGVCATRYRAFASRRIGAEAMAHEVDSRDENGDLFVTGLAIERGEASGDEGFAALVTACAEELAPHVDPTSIAPIQLPYKPALAGLASILLAGLVHFGADAILPSIAAASDGREPAEVAENDLPAVEPEAEAEAPVLSADARAQLEADAKRLDEMKKTPGLSDEAKASLAKASEQLEKAAKKDAKSLDALDAMTRAQREMDRLEEKSRDGRHIDKKKLDEMSSKDLADQAKKAAEQRDSESLADAAEALARKMEAGEAGLSEQDRERLAKLMRDAAEKRDAGDKAAADAEKKKKGLKRLSRESESKKGSSSSGAEKKKDGESESMRRLAKLLRDGDREGAKRELERLSREARERSARSGEGKKSFSRRISGVKERTESSRRRTMASLGGKSRTCDDPSKCSSTASRPGSKPGEGGKDGKRGGKPGEGQGSKPGEGKMPGSGSGPQQAGNSAGMPGSSKSKQGGQGITRKGGSSPAPGGGKGGKGPGSRARGDAGGGSEWVESQWKEGGESIVKAIERVNRGEDSVVGYKQIHRSYESIAETAAEQEEIPLTRRTFIRNYFEAIRPESP